MMFKKIKLTNLHVFYFLTAVAVLSLAGSARAHFNSGDVAWWIWWDGALQNFSTEMLGAIITFGLIEVIMGSRNRHEELVRQLRAGDFGVFNRLNDEGIHLRDVDLSSVRWNGLNLEGANLGDANLEGANLEGANLRGVNLKDANLKDANLKDTNLEGVILPNGILWEQNVYMGRFTDNTHSNYDVTLEGVNNSRFDIRFKYTK